VRREGDGVVLARAEICKESRFKRVSVKIHVHCDFMAPRIGYDL